MHVRVTTVTGASDIDGGLAALRDQALPQMRQHHGFRGLSASGDRAAGVVTITRCPVRGLWARSSARMLPRSLVTHRLGLQGCDTR